MFKSVTLAENSETVILVKTKTKNKNLLRFLLAQAYYLGFDTGMPSIIRGYSIG